MYAAVILILLQPVGANPTHFVCSSAMPPSSRRFFLNTLGAPGGPSVAKLVDCIASRHSAMAVAIIKVGSKSIRPPFTM
jgi:hypothetical protein